MTSKNFFWTLLLFVPFLMNAQVKDTTRATQSIVVLVEEKDYTNVEDGDHFVTLGLFNGSGFLQYRYYYSDRSALRLGLTGRLTSTITDENPESEPVERTTTTSRNLDFTIGVQTAFLKLDRLESYVALDLSPGYEATATETKTPVYAAGDYQYTTVRQTEEPYFNARLLPVIGANVYVYKGLSVGLEYRMTLISYRQQLDYTEKVFTENADGDRIDDPVTYEVFERDSKTVSAGFTGTAFVTVGLRLNK